jgi:hypothetical protein
MNFSSRPNSSKKFGFLSSGGAKRAAASILSLKYSLSSPNGSNGWPGGQGGPTYSLYF